jgi:hypothetical protein
MIGKQSGQFDLAGRGIEHKPGVLDEINAALNWKRFEALLHKVFSTSRARVGSIPGSTHWRRFGPWGVHRS